MDILVNALTELYAARQARRDAKEAFKVKCQELGPCPEDPYCHYSYDANPFRCARCQVTQPLWQEYHKQATRAGVALRMAVRLGKFLAKKEHA